ncbi:hypothetical protein [Fundidesulfovibrio soli]|uniref:hypothetical protein n=1 Tax=Fundidesulfovibrio soli TaxID=2922716 RepID=UPI001FB0424A
MKTGVTKEWAITMAFSVLVFLALGLGLTWVNIERVDMAYELKRLQTEIVAQESLISKLEVERNTMLTPERLRVLASQYGLTQARPGQIRRLGAAGEELASPVIKAAPPAPEKVAKKKPEDCPPSKVMKKAPRSKVAGPAGPEQDAKRKKST